VSAYGCYVKFTANIGQRGRLVELLLEAAAGIQTVEGCELYIVNISPAESETVWVTEVWRSKEEHDASLTLESAKELIQRALPLLAKPPELIPIQPVGGKGLEHV